MLGFLTIERKRRPSLPPGPFRAELLNIERLEEVARTLAVELRDARRRRGSSRSFRRRLEENVSPPIPTTRGGEAGPGTRAPPPGCTASRSRRSWDCGVTGRSSRSHLAYRPPGPVFRSPGVGAPHGTRSRSRIPTGVAAAWPRRPSTANPSTRGRSPWPTRQVFAGSAYVSEARRRPGSSSVSARAGRGRSGFLPTTASGRSPRRSRSEGAVSSWGRCRSSPRNRAPDRA